MPFNAGIDLGATRSSACRSDRLLAPEILPTVVFAAPDGTLRIGEDAERHARTDPGRVARQFTRRIGDATPLLVGGVPMPAEVLAARFVTGLLDRVTERDRPVRIAVTHPVGWGPFRLTALREALAGQGLGDVLLLPDAQAAVLANTASMPVDVGATVAVYDLGGATFDAAVLRRVSPDRFEPVGRPEQLEVGGLDFDELVFGHVTSALGQAWQNLDSTDPATLAAVADLRRGCIAAKEALSADTDVVIPVALPGIDTRVRLARAELEELIRPAVDETVAALHRAIGPAQSDLAAVLLVGGSARIPLITQTVSAQLGRPVMVPADPKGSIAAGAAIAAGASVPPPTAYIPLPPPIPSPPLPVTVGPPRVPKRGLPRTAVTAVAAAVLGIAAATGIVLTVRNHQPVDAGADPVTTTTTSVEQPVDEQYTEPETTTRDRPRNAGTSTPQRKQTTPKTTTRPTTTTTTGTTTPTPTTTTTTRTSPSTAGTTSGGAR